MIDIGTKMYIIDNKGKKIPCTVTDSWDADEYHSAGFWVDIFYPHYVSKYEFKEDQIGKSIFYANK